MAILFAVIAFAGGPEFEGSGFSCQRVETFRVSVDPFPMLSLPFRYTWDAVIPICFLFIFFLTVTDYKVLHDLGKCYCYCDKAARGPDLCIVKCHELSRCGQS